MNAVRDMHKTHPDIKIHIHRGDMVDVCDRLDKGLIDFGLLMQPADLSKYENMRLPYVDRWGLLMHKNHPLANKEYITPNDIKDVPIMQSRHSLPKSQITEWYKSVAVNVVGTYNLLNNAALAAYCKVGCVLCIDKLINTTNSDLVFKPLNPPVEVELDVVWKKYQAFSKSAQIFLKYLKETIS